MPTTPEWAFFSISARNVQYFKAYKDYFKCAKGACFEGKSILPKYARTISKNCKGILLPTLSSKNIVAQNQETFFA